MRTRNCLSAWALIALMLMAPAGGLWAQEAGFGDGWTLQPETSSINFQSVKNMTIAESSSFATFSGTIAPDGVAEIHIALESVDTKIDLRNVRMRFLFFETYQFPEAVITARIDPARLAGLEQSRRMTVPLDYVLSLHGVSKSFATDVTVTLIQDDVVIVSTVRPISVAAADFALEGGIQKLEEAAKVAIVPSATVTFDFAFRRNAAGGTAAAAPAPATSAALEPQGNLDAAACTGRFEILSRSGNIFFASGRAVLDQRSAPLLDTLADIIERCPGMRIAVAGHTDSDGSAASNLTLSQRRAQAVVDYLSAKGVDVSRVEATGYGEARPIVPNNTPENKGRNRRIEFFEIHG